MLFLSRDENQAAIARYVVEEILLERGLTLLGWRKVPVDASVLGPQARENQPQIEQVIVSSPQLQGDDLDRQLFLTRRAIGHALSHRPEFTRQDFYSCSFSCRTIVYKGMLRSAVLGESPTLQHQHHAPLALSSTDALAGTQRRNQHAVGQYYLDEGATSDFSSPELESSRYQHVQPNCQF